MKKLLAVLLALMLVFSIAACGSEDPPADGENPPAKNGGGEEASPTQSGTNFEAFVSELGDTYYMEMETQEDIDGSGNLVTLQVKSAAKKDKVMSESKYSGEHIIMIYVDDTAYMVMPSQKLFMKTPMEEGVLDEVMNFSDSMDYSAVSAGTDEIEGVTYDYEEVSIDGVIERYYFDKNGKLAYIGTQEQYIKIVEYGSEVEDSWFEIPADYTEMPAV